MKKLTILLVSILAITLVIAGEVALTNIDSVFTPKKPPEVNYSKGDVTFDCGKTKMTITLNEIGSIDDDFEEKASLICKEQISNAVDYKGRKYQTNEYGLRSFNQDKLNKNVCTKKGMLYDAVKDVCYKPFNFPRIRIPLKQ